MKTTKKLNFIEWNNGILISSIKNIDLNIILIIILDFLFYISSGYLFIFWLQRVQAKMTAFNIPTDITALGVEKAQQLVSDVKAFYFLIIASLVLLLTAIIFLMSIFKGIIWAKTTGTKTTFKLISKFLALNLIWAGFWFVVVFLVSYLVEPAAAPMAMLVAVILALYFTNTLYALFMRKQQFKSILGAIKLNIAKIHLFLLPYSAIGLLLFIIVRLLSLFKFQYSSILLGLVLIVYAAAVRYYVSNLVYEIEKLK